MRSDKAVTSIVISALLCAVGIVIPMVSPFKIVLEPASFTLGSHIAVMIAMFVSPGVATAVALGTTLGFFLGGFPLVIVLRAASHVVFAFFGAWMLKSGIMSLKSLAKIALFCFAISLVHALLEVAVVIPFYFGKSMGDGYYAKGFLYTVLGLVGGGTVVHSFVDFALALVIWRGVKRALRLPDGFSIA